MSSPELTDRWENSARFIVPPIAASISIVPVFYGYTAKTAKQLGKPCPRISSPEFRVNLLKAIPTFGTAVGVQMVAKSIVETALLSIKGERSEKSFSSLVMSSMIVGSMAAPPLAVFNGQSGNLSMVHCFRRLNVTKVVVIAMRQTSFLMGLSLSESVSETMKRYYGNNRLMVLSFAFIGGALGSLIGHPADTLVTLWQNGKKLEKVSHLGRGGVYRAGTIGFFSVSYQIINDVFLKRF